MLRLFFVLSSFVLVSLAWGSDLQIHVPHHFDILQPNTALECRYVADDHFGFLLERGAGEKIHVSLITNGQNEGTGSAFDIGVKARAAIGLHLYLYERTGSYGRYVEFELKNQVDPFLNYQLPATYMQVSALYSRAEDGSEKEVLYPDVMKRLACRIR